MGVFFGLNELKKDFLMSSKEVLKVNALSKFYKSYRKPYQKLIELLLKKESKENDVRILNNISFSLERGKVLGVIGPNGAGKSTLLQVIAGTISPTQGEVTIDGRVTALLELGAGIDPEMTGRENIYLMGNTYGIEDAVIKSKEDNIIGFSGLKEAIDNPVKTYSSGMFVRLAFSVSTALEPDVLIVDEALAVGDVGFQAKCLDRLEQLIAEGTSILLASHDMQLIKNYCSSAICMNNGEIVESGDPEVVSERYLHLMKGVGQEPTGSLRWSIDEEESAVRFESDKGKISGFEVASDAAGSVICSGKQVEIRVKIKLYESNVRPSVSVILRDFRGYNIYGLRALLSLGQLRSLSNMEYEAIFYMPLALADGNYSFTVRLEDARTEKVSEVLDKRVGMCEFIISSEKKDFLGAVNLGGCIREYNDA